MNFKTALLSILDEDRLVSISEETVERFNLQESTQKRLDKLKSFVNSIQSISDDINESSIVKLIQEFDDEEDEDEEGYWRPFLYDVQTEEIFPIDLIPFEELFTYQVEGLTDDIGLLSEVMVELTFDGFTIEEQQISIMTFEDSLASLE
ncbi:hypothetical protein [Vagococcus xieshaowenii]|uniref:Uncharacterized protein n=1 Tax=Vagococcus xieshaowenii TaxID=2562451 RepID=A0A4Z0D6T8_9ENTE|nr:hypothetical protein [Vagococcus xieshaowenii]QCA28616.1 hypothetical protein E4Z98_04525 [Vagococcus xieshaowenii]TFZ40576.1 hypothetical protein E4031_07250 [Vagococcus xieshaowenii]